VTLRDVARQAGVSVATTSRSLNDRAHVQPETRERVLQAANDLGFSVRRPNTRTTNRRTVGLLTSDPGGRMSMAVLRGVEDALGAGEIDVLLCASRGDPIREQHYLRTLADRRVDGIIVVGDSTNPRPPIDRRQRVPVIYAFAPSESHNDVSFVPDEQQGARLLVRHLLALGRTRIAHVAGPEEWWSARHRLLGVTNELAVAGLHLVGPAMYGPDWSQRWGRHAATMLLRSDPDVDAIIGGCDQIAVGVMDTLRDNGRVVPEDVAVVGFDNWEVFAADSWEPLTTIDMRLERVGRAAAHALFSTTGHPTAPGTYSLSCTLVIRESAGLAHRAATPLPPPVEHAGR